MRAFIAAGAAGAVLITAAAMAQSEAPKPQGRAAGMQAAQALASWQAKPKEVAQTMIGKYGQPQEVTASRLMWHNNRPWKLTKPVNEEAAHDYLQGLRFAVPSGDQGDRDKPFK